MTRFRLPFAGVIVAIAAVVAIVVTTTGGSAKTVRPAVAPASAISVHQTSLGKTLVDANGRSLYLFQADRRNVSTLSAAGRAVWPPFTANTKPASLGGVAGSHVGTIKGANGRFQITYYGHPLYYYVGDHSPGQTRGQGLNQFGARWYVLGPAGNAIVSAPRSPAPTAPSNGGSGYGY
jgi:predicted lipoprotein with Yx(FWY)xxD motif